MPYFMLFRRDYKINTAYLNFPVLWSFFVWSGNFIDLEYLEMIEDLIQKGSFSVISPSIKSYRNMAKFTGVMMVGTVTEKSGMAIGYLTLVGHS